jgi:hypothetical protein
MSTSRKTLTVLVAAALAPAFAQAADDNAQTLELKSRLIHFDREYENSANDRSQSALGLQLNYESAYFGDVIGFGLSGYSVTKLGASGRITSDILSVDKDGDAHDSFGKLGQAFIKLKYQDAVRATLGRQVHKSMLLSSSGSRAIPNSFSGGSVEVKPMKGLTFYGAIYNEWSPRSDAHFYEFKTDRSAEGDIKYIGIFGANYKDGPIAANFEYLNSKDFLAKFGLVGSYTFNLANKDKLTLTAGVHTSKDDGKLFVTGAESAELDDEDVPGAKLGTTPSHNDSTAVYLEGEWVHGGLKLGAALAKFDGAWIEDNFAGDHGTNPFPTGGVLADMTNDGEFAWMLSAGYDWKKILPGLTTTASIKRGSGAQNSHVAALGKADEQELALDVRYKIPAVKGLSFRYLYLDYNSDKTGRLDGVKEDETDHRIYLDYSYRFL